MSLLVDRAETYRKEFTIVELSGVFTAYLNGCAIAGGATDSLSKCKSVINSDYPARPTLASSAYYEQMDFEDNSEGPILGWEDNDSDLRHNHGYLL